MRTSSSQNPVDQPESLELLALLGLAAKVVKWPKADWLVEASGGVCGGVTAGTGCCGATTTESGGGDGVAATGDSAVASTGLGDWTCSIGGIFSALAKTASSSNAGLK